MKPLLITYLIGLVLLAPRLPAAEKPLPPKTDEGLGGQVIWREDFASPDSLTRFGIAEKYRKPDRLRVEDGALRGQSHKEDDHPTILTRGVAGTDVRMTALVKIPANSYATLIFMGKTRWLNGPCWCAPTSSRTASPCSKTSMSRSPVKPPHTPSPLHIQGQLDRPPEKQFPSSNAAFPSIRTQKGISYQL